jgi:hypothetical protein
LLYKTKVRTIAFLCLLAITGSDTAFLLIAQQGTAQETSQQKSQSKLPSMSETQTMLFDGRVFYLKSDKHRLKEKIYDYFLPNESPSNYTESIGLSVSSKLLRTNQPGNQASHMDILANQAVQTAQALKFLYPPTKCDIERDHKSDKAFLNCVSLLMDRNVLEVHICKFYIIDSDDRVLEFRYIKTVQGISGKERTYMDVGAETAAVREKVLPIMRGFPLYRP